MYVDKTNYPLEVFGDDNKSMIEQGIKINCLGKNVYVKVPVLTRKINLLEKLLKN